MKKLLPIYFKDYIKNIIYKLIQQPNPVSFAQAGEDRILAYLLEALNIKNPSYLDVGTNHPIIDNNTYLFYLAGSRGVCVEADPSLIKEIESIRKYDKCLNVGVTFDDRTEADFYIFSASTLNTLSQQEAEQREKHSSSKIVKKIKIPLKNINDIISENFTKTPDILSLDVEGIDFEILKSLNFSKYRPIAISVETISYSESRNERKLTEIIDFVISKGYFVYADTHINTIFVDEKAYRNQHNND